MKDLLKNYSYALISHWRSGDETFEVIIGGTNDGKRIVFKTHLVRNITSLDGFFRINSRNMFANNGKIA